MWILAWDGEQLLGDPRRRLLARRDVLRRQHLPSGAADARLLRAPVRAGGPDPSGLRRSPATRSSATTCCSSRRSCCRGSGMYLLVRELTGNAAGGVRRRPAVRVRAVPPAAVARTCRCCRRSGCRSRCTGCRRYFDDAGGARPLAGAAAGARRAGPVVRLLPALLPAVRGGLRAVGDWRSAGCWRDRRDVGAAWRRGGRGRRGCTAPFLLPYAALRSSCGMARARSRGHRGSRRTCIRTPPRSASSALWGDVHAGVPEGRRRAVSRVGPLVLALVGVLVCRRGAAATATAATSPTPRCRSARRRGADGCVALLLAALPSRIALACSPCSSRRIVDRSRAVRAADQQHQPAAAARGGRVRGCCSCVSPARAPAHGRVHARPRLLRRRRCWRPSWLSLGPVAAGARTPAGNRRAVRRALRLRARVRRRCACRRGSAMVVALMLAVLGGYGAAALGARGGAGARSLVAGSRCFLARRHASCRSWSTASTPTARLQRAGGAASTARRGRPPSTRGVARQPDGGVLAELPLGQPDFDLRAMYLLDRALAAAAQRLQRLLPAALRPAARSRSATCRGIPTRAATRCADAGATHVHRPRRRVPRRRRRGHVRCAASTPARPSSTATAPTSLLRAAAAEAWYARLPCLCAETYGGNGVRRPGGHSAARRCRKCGRHAQSSGRASATSSWSRFCSRSALTASSPTSA